MANYQLLKADIDEKVYQNGKQEITGVNLNSVLNAMVTTLGAGYQFMGVATPQTNPGTPDPKVFYIASTAGTYSNFGGIVLADGEFAILCYNGNWNKVVTDAVTFKNFSLIKAGSELQNLDNFANGVFSLTSSGKISNLPADVDLRGGCLLFVIRRGNDTLRDWDRQVLLSINSPGYLYGRVYYNRQWQEWAKRELGVATNLIECGVGKQFTTLRSAVAAAIQTNGTKVIVYPGTYDLTQEFATELANHSGSGILLTNDVHVIFMPGAYVTCMVDVSNEWAYTNFEPFRVNVGNFTLENANINCKNTRYNVHDELGGHDAQYIHRYINCIMEHFDENPNAYYPQCIGGGLGEHGYIEIIGGVYSSHATHGGDNSQIGISYHNGDNVNADSKIVIKDVYLKDKGYIRFGAYGPSEKASKALVCGCSFGQPIANIQEISGGSATLFDLLEWNNELRTQ